MQDVMFYIFLLYEMLERLLTESFSITYAFFTRVFKWVKEYDEFGIFAVV